jgi:YVTN family beta-propeller protein
VTQLRLIRSSLTLLACAVAGWGAVPARAAAGAPRGENQLLNPGAEAGASSGQGWDSVTIPGWGVATGLPTVVRYGTKGFPATAGSGRPRAGGQLFAGGAGGTARLVQWVRLRSAGGTPLATGSVYRLAARLGGSATSAASLTVSFYSSAGRLVGRNTLGPVGGRSRSASTKMTLRSLTGRLPVKAARAEITLRLATALHDIDGPDSPTVGYDRAVADDLRFAVRAPIRPAPSLRPPAAHIPRYDHVFLFYFENQDVRAIVGNRRKAPYYNSLLTRGSELNQLYAEEHPSDGNYLALAGGSVFGIPLTDPLEVNSQYTIRAPNIGDLVNAAHESWRAYNESAAGPCDDTVHRDYWNDDLPLLYFADIRLRPGYCSSHVLPLESMSGDLANASTTPNFVWVGVNDCDDMEGCGIRAGDRFLADQLGQIMRSPAWRTQRSLAIITFDEDAYDHEHPAQRVSTLVLGSAGVRRGYVSSVRYTHYSLLRTIEGALGLGTLTANDRYAQPVNDVFTAGRVPADARSAATAAPRRSATAFVVNSASKTVTPVTLATRLTGTPIRVGRDPQSIALTPDDRTAYVVNSGSDSVTPIDTATRRARAAIGVGDNPQAIAVTPDGRTAYVSNDGSDSVTPIDVGSGRAGTPIPVGAHPRKLAIAPNGRTLYVLNWGGATVTPIDTATERALPAIPVGAFPSAIAVARDGRSIYVVNYGSGTVTPIDAVTNQAGRAIRAGTAPNALGLTPDGSIAEVVDGNTNQVTPIATARLRAQRPIRVGQSPTAIAVSPSGATAYVVNTISGTVTPIATANGHAGKPISVGTYAYPTAIALAPGGRTAVVAGTYSGRVRLLNTRTRAVSSAIKVGGFPVAVAITR